VILFWKKSDSTNSLNKSELVEFLLLRLGKSDWSIDSSNFNSVETQEKLLSETNQVQQLKVNNLPFIVFTVNMRWCQLHDQK